MRTATLQAAAWMALAISLDGSSCARGGRSRQYGSGWGSTISITQDAHRLTGEYAFFGCGDTQPRLRFVHALDGSETRNSRLIAPGRILRPRAPALLRRIPKN